MRGLGGLRAYGLEELATVPFGVCCADSQPSRVPMLVL